MAIFPEFCTIKPIFFGNPNSNLVNRAPSEEKHSGLLAGTSPEALVGRTRPDIECLLNGGAVIFHRPGPSEFSEDRMNLSGFASVVRKGSKGKFDRKQSGEILGVQSVSRRKSSVTFKAKREGCMSVVEKGGIGDIGQRVYKEDWTRHEGMADGRASLVNLAELLDIQNIGETLDGKLSGSIRNIHMQSRSTKKQRISITSMIMMKILITFQLIERADVC